MQTLPFNALVDVPWKNGGGVTRNIATGTLGRQTAWRISRADVDTLGPFSNFTGLTRILTVLSENTMDLVHAQGKLQARRWEPLEFDGGLSVTADLKDGPLTDLNLMFDPTLCTGHARVLNGRRLVEAQSGKLTALHILKGNPNCAGSDLNIGDTVFLEPSDAQRKGAPSVELGPEDAVLELTLQAISQSEDIKLCIADR